MHIEKLRGVFLYENNIYAERSLFTLGSECNNHDTRNVRVQAEPRGACEITYTIYISDRLFPDCRPKNHSYNPKHRVQRILHDFSVRNHNQDSSCLLSFQLT